MKKMLLTLGALFALITLFAPLVSAQTNQKPVGSFDAATCDILGGWAKDADTPSDAIAVHFWELASNGWQFVAATTANFSRSDVGAHAFGITTPEALKDGQKHVIYAFGIDSAPAHTNNAVLANSPKELTCSAASLQGTVSSASGLLGGSTLNLYQMAPAGEAIFVNSEYSADGNFAFTADYNGNALTNGTYQIWASADKYQYAYVNVSYTRSAGGTGNVVLTHLPLTVSLNGSSPNIASTDGQLQVSAKVCNYSYTGGQWGNYMQVKLVLSGPGKFQDYTVRDPQVWWYVPPAVGQCGLYTLTLDVDSSLPDGQNYCGEVKVGSIDYADEYSRTSVCAPKGVQDLSAVRAK